MKLIASTLVCALFVASVSCSSVKYGDVNDEETLNIDYGITDRQRFADTMVQSLIESPALGYLQHPGKGDDLRVIVYMGGVANSTSEHIDTQGITDAIRTSLLKSGRFRFVAGKQGQSEIDEQIRFQQGSGKVNPAMAKETGKQLGADVVLYGVLRSIQKQRGRSFESGGVKTRRTDYQFVLNCENIETGEIVWSDIKDLTKSSKTGLFGSN